MFKLVLGIRLILNGVLVKAYWFATQYKTIIVIILDYIMFCFAANLESPLDIYEIQFCLSKLLFLCCDRVYLTYEGIIDLLMSFAII